MLFLCDSCIAKFTQVVMLEIVNDCLSVCVCYFKNCDLKRKIQSPHPLQEEAEIKRLTDSVQCYICVSISYFKLLQVHDHSLHYCLHA